MHTDQKLQVTAQVYLNETFGHRFFEFRPDSKLGDAGKVTVSVRLHEDMPSVTDAVLNTVYAACSMGSNREDRPYFVRGCRSISVGDVIVLDGVAFSVEGFSFQKVTLDPSQIDPSIKYS